MALPQTTVVREITLNKPVNNERTRWLNYYDDWEMPLNLQAGHLIERYTTIVHAQ